MFTHLHHRTWFPLVVIGLSLILLLLVVWSLMAWENNPAVSYEATSTVTAEQYQKEVGTVMKNFWSQYESQVNDAARLSFVSETEQKLLALRVPTEDQSVHFELASGLGLLRQGLVGDAEKLAEGTSRLQKAFSDNLWLTQ